MATLQDFRNERLRKLADITRLGINPYPSTVARSHSLKDVVSDFDQLEGSTVTVAGRINAIRKFGKLAFIVLKEGGVVQLQLFIRKHDTEGEVDRSQSELRVPEELPLLDSGDFVEATGTVIKTQTGEISVEVQSLRLLAKALRPLPNDIDGFTDKEQRLRRRYVDMNSNPEVRERFVRRSRFWQATREFLLKEGFVEINIPVLEQTAGGADAKPFVTHMDALDQDFFLRISHELPLKRLLVAGYDKVFDIGPRFRNENYSDEHLPEHVAMEWYWAYANWQQGMELTQRLVRSIVDATWGTRHFTLANKQTIDIGEDGVDWPHLSFVTALRDAYGIDVFDTTLEQVQSKVREHHIEVERSDNMNRCIDKLWKKLRVDIAGPTFLVDIPAFLQPLAKTQALDNRLSEQFNLLLGGTEVCKAYSELNDPLDQLHRFIDQQQLRDAGDNEAMMLDIDFIEALEYGMPPACGYGHSERLFWMLEGVTAREGVPFPQLRREMDDTTRVIYADILPKKDS